MEDSGWYNSAEEFGTLDALVRQGRHLEAIDRARLTLLSGQAGRRSAARLHTLICRLYTEELQQPCPAAILHAEEAVRLAEAVRDPWIKCEALSRIVHACCQVGDRCRAASACDALAAEVERNAAVVPGGHAAVLMLRATVAMAGEEWPLAMALLRQAEAAGSGEAPEVAARVYADKVVVLLASGAYGDARALLAEPVADPEGESAVAVARELARAWLAVVSLAEGPDPAEASRLAHLTHQRTVCLGRVDMARWLRRRLLQLL
ncbi:MAG: hypothetical protein JWN15_1505 [Firmicutes bacterium]|nr:hypothetical protein [Bacillota bacterium]